MTSARDTEGRWPRCLTRALAAEYCSISVSTFNENMNRGAFPQPFVLPTGSMLWDRLELDAAIEALKDGTSPSVARPRFDLARQAQERRRGAS